MQAIFDALRQRSRDRSASADDVLAEAARAHAAGQSPDLQAVDAALHDSGRSVSDFEELCRVAAKRREAFRDFDTLAAARSRLAKAEAAVAAESAKFEEFQRLHQSKVGKLEAGRREAARQIERGEAARRLLTDPANVLGSARPRLEAALAEHEAAEIEHAALAREHQHVERRIAEEDRWIVSNLKAAGLDILAASPLTKKVVGVPESVRHDNEGHELQRDRAKRRLREIKPQLQAAADRLDKATQQLKKAEESALKS